MDAGGFDIRVSRAGDDLACLALTGELDLSRVGRLEEVVRAARADARHLELDLRELTFIDSSGLKALVAVHQAAEDGDFTYNLVPGPPIVHRTFVLTGLDQVLRFAGRPG